MSYSIERQQILSLYGYNQDRLVRENERKTITTISRTQAWVLEQKGAFPKRKKLGAREGANKSYGTRAFTGNPLILND
ncbi:helix-turn-helix transcriptional regulator [Aeromonas caviae]|uniref:helix-turn-helix transcriptional regulator n=1 Tax=Aeromonas caviae TaxID=648 RepID=UPI0038CF665E